MASAGTVQIVVVGIVLVGLFAVVFWRIARSRAARCGAIALAVYFILVEAIKLKAPEWVTASLLTLFFLLGLLTMVFLITQAYSAVRRKKRN